MCIKNLAYLLRVAAAKTPHPIKLGHAQQLISAAFGYRSLAAYQACQSENRIQYHDLHFIIDTVLLEDRADELGIKHDHASLLVMLSEVVSQEFPDWKLHSSESKFLDYLHNTVQFKVLNDEGVCRQTAMINANGIRECDLPFDFSMDMLPDLGEVLEIPIQGHISFHVEEDRIEFGDRVNVDFQLDIERVGKMLLRTSMVSSEKEYHDFPFQNKISMAQALAEELDLDLASAEMLVDVEQRDDTGHSGEMTYNYILDFTEIAPPDIAKKILAKRGSLIIYVPLNFYDCIHQPID